MAAVFFLWEKSQKQSRKTKTGLSSQPHLKHASQIMYCTL